MRNMRLLLISSVLGLLIFSSCEDVVQDILNDDEVIAGLKEALNVSTDTAVANGSEYNGYYLNPDIKIPFPEEADIVMTVVEAVPGGDILVDEFLELMNHAAEDAAEKATPIFKDAILGISFTDAMGILEGSDTAATNYLRINTFSELFDEFKPDIEASLDAVGAQDAWEELINFYNDLPLTDPVEADLATYTTNEGLDGLFFLVGEEEQRIRNDIAHQVTDLLQEIFGN